jgi:hypothetical protein
MTGTQLELFPLTALRTAPDYIGKDEFTGGHTVKFNPRKYQVARYSAAELALLSDHGVFFESFGSVRGVEHFGRTRYIADGQGNLHCYDSDGAKKIVHPASRALRVLTGK